MDFGIDQRTGSPVPIPQSEDAPVRGSEISSNRRRRSTADGGTKFYYKPLDRSKGAVRLIKVFPLRQNNLVYCRIERHHISTVRYVALSYVWGSQDADCEIMLNGQPFRVKPNLFAFLRHLAKTGYFTDTLFWIDAISMDQNNMTEKNHHISHVGTIYSQASKVIAWLGNSSYYTLSGLKPPSQWICCKDFTSERTSRTRHRCDWPVPYVSSWNLLRHEYWSRLWVAQELSLARHVDVLWRSRFYSWLQIRECLGRNMNNIRECRHGPTPLTDSFVSNTKYLQDLPVARYLKPTYSAPLGTLVPRFASHRCQIGHDHAFAVLSMATDGERFEPDYEENPILLLLRLMTFCYTSPTATYIGKIGSALGIEPRRDGIPIKFIGHPRILETVGGKVVHFRLADSFPEPLESTDVLIQLPDTNLYMLYRESSSSDIETLYTPIARVNVVSPLVEQGRKKFTSNRARKTAPAANAAPLSQSPAWVHVLLKKNLSTGTLRLCCDWQTVLSVFDLSETQVTPGRLESRIREWTCPINIPVEQYQTFSISKEAIQAGSKLFNERSSLSQFYLSLTSNTCTIQNLDQNDPIERLPKIADRLETTTFITMSSQIQASEQAKMTITSAFHIECRKLFREIWAKGGVPMDPALNNLLSITLIITEFINALQTFEPVIEGLLALLSRAESLMAYVKDVEIAGKPYPPWLTGILRRIFNHFAEGLFERMHKYAAAVEMGWVLVSEYESEEEDFVFV